MIRWGIERIIHFGPTDVSVEGLAYFGFHDRAGRQYVIDHQKHFLGCVGPDNSVAWTAANREVIPGVANIPTDLKFPMYVDTLLDGGVIASNFGNNRLYRIDVGRRKSEVLVEGSTLGMMDMGNCVVDDEGCVWVNEVEGCRIWRFDAAGKPLLTLGDGKPGFNPDGTGFDDARFNWIYDIRRGPDGNTYVLDSKNFAVRMVDLKSRSVRTLVGTGRGGYDGDGGDARAATFGSDPSAYFDGPISLAVDERGNLFVGDRFNHAVRMVNRGTGVITTIAGRPDSRAGEKNLPGETDPLKVNLPEISSMDYYDGRLFIPTDLDDGGDLIVLRKSGK